MSLLHKFGDATNSQSYAAALRRRRFEFLTRLISNLDRPLRILDVGGTPDFWEQMQFPENDQIELTILNVSAQPSRRRFKTLVGDARDMRGFPRQTFDVVFSNSVIEHVGTLAQQRQMAEECLRVGARLFLQTPNRFFPIEPHFILPFMQFAPLSAQLWLTSHFSVGGYGKLTDRQKNLERIGSVRLLRRTEVIDLFPNATVYGEKLARLTKSFIVCVGWSDSDLNSGVIGLPTLIRLYSAGGNSG